MKRLQRQRMRLARLLLVHHKLLGLQLGQTQTHPV